MSVKTNSPLLEINHISKDFILPGREINISPKIYTAVNDVCLQLRSGEALGIVGESGCGKSTMARLITGLETLTRGEILFEQKSIKTWLTKDAIKYRQSVQMVFQDSIGALNPRLSIHETLENHLKRLTDFSGQQRQKRIHEILEQVQLPTTTLTRYPHEFSGGQAQRINIARSLLTRPKLIVMDEPVSALDVSVQAEILKLLDSMRRELQLTYLFISHDLGVVEQLCSQVLVMFAGKIVEQGETSRLFSGCCHPYTDLLFKSIPSIHKQFSLKQRIPVEAIPANGCVFRNRCSREIEQCLESPRLEGHPEEKNITHRYACHNPIKN